MPRKVYVNVQVRLIISADEAASIGDVLSNMDYNFSPSSADTDVTFEDSEITNWEITDSK